MKTHQELKMSIMGRIYMAYALRRVFRSSTIRALLSVGSLAAVLSLVSVLNVIKNMSNLSNLRDMYTFSVSALSNTEVAVQLSLLVFFGALVWYARDILRAGSFFSSRTQTV